MFSLEWLNQSFPIGVNQKDLSNVQQQQLKKNRADKPEKKSWPSKSKIIQYRKNE